MPAAKTHLPSFCVETGEDFFGGVETKKYPKNGVLGGKGV
jgi:hypothetical protein